MKLEFEYNNCKYTLNIYNIKTMTEEKIFSVTIHIHPHNPDSLDSFIIKAIKHNKIFWSSGDDIYIPKGGQEYCNRLINLMFLA